MLASEVAALCKKLRLSRNLAENAIQLGANTHQEYLLRFPNVNEYLIHLTTNF
jgi:hypothetical protein